MNRNIGILKSIYITFTHNFFLTLLPFKLGELVYIKKMKEQNIQTSKGFSDILTIRLYDSLVLGVLIVISFLLLGFDFSYFTILFLGVVFVVFYLFFFKIKIVLKILDLIKSKIKFKIIGKIISFVGEGLLNISKLSDRNKII
ncbi:MAG: lysylphosphatidylglycerol synthase domain-containing protein, partial [Candidatus Absconditabacteria bacterium]